MAPCAIRSEATNTASSAGSSSRSWRIATSPESRVKSPTATIERRLELRSSDRYPASRSMPATMSCGPAIVAIRCRPESTRRRTAATAPLNESTSTYGTGERPSGRPLQTTGTPIRASAVGSG